jgi:hypothetical protein
MPCCLWPEQMPADLHPGLRFDRLDGKGKASYFEGAQAAFDRDYGSLSGLFASVIEQTVKHQRRASRR